MTLSAIDSGRGGALVPPPAFASPLRGRKRLVPPRVCRKAFDAYLAKQGVKALKRSKKDPKHCYEDTTGHPLTCPDAEGATQSQGGSSVQSSAKPKPQRKTPVAKKKPAAKPEPLTPVEAARQIHQIKETANTDDPVSLADARQRVEDILSPLPGGRVIEIARSLGLRTKLQSKKSAVRAVADSVVERLDRAQRSREFSEGPKEEKPPASPIKPGGQAIWSEHPYAGKSRDEILIAAYAAAGNWYKTGEIDPVGIADHIRRIVPEKLKVIQRAVKQAVRGKDDFGNLAELPHLWDAVRREVPDATVLDFQAALVDGNRSGVWRLHPHTRSPHSNPSGELVFPLGPEVYSYVRDLPPSERD